MSDVKNARDRPGVEPVWDKNQPLWDRLRPLGTSGGLRGISGADRLLYGAVAVVALGIGIVNALSKAQDVAWNGGVYDARMLLFWELSSVVAIIVLSPALFAAVRWTRRASEWPQRTGLALAAIVAFSTLHIAGMVGLRKIGMLLVGGSYDFHLSVATLIYEFRKDMITCLLIGGAVWLIDGHRQAQSRPPVMAAPADPPFAPPHTVWLRDGSTRIRIEPRDILWISSAGNYVEYSLKDGIHHLVRGTLNAEEARLTPFNIVRVHRTRLVNLARVSGLKTSANGDFELTLDTGQAISGSRRYRSAVSSIGELAANPAPAPADNAARS